MNWKQLMNSGRIGDPRENYDKNESRSAFQRDFDRIVFSSAFRRLQDKTQVFPVPASDFVHSRLTHSIEVSSVGRTLGNMAGEFVLEKEPGLKSMFSPSMFGDVTAAASLAHDVGNPPFGHSGEDAISEFFVKRKNDFAKFNLTEAQWNDFTRYEGNAHGFRLLTNHHPDEIKGGLRLTYATLATFAKYPRESYIPEEELVREDLKRTSAKKFNFFQTERSLFKETAAETGLRPLTVTSSESLAYCRHPLAFLVEAADNICYRLIDLEDGYKLGFLDFNTVEELLIPFMKMSGDKNQAMTKYGMIKDKGEKVGYLRAKAISVLINESIEVFKENYNEIMNGNFDAEITDHISSTKLLEGEIKKANIYLYNRKPVVEIEITGYKIIAGLLEMFLDAQYNQDNKLNKKLLQQLPGQFRAVTNDTDYEKIMKTVDYVARMSDSYALNLYRRLSGQSLPVIG
jgi:dGTPase